MKPGIILLFLLVVLAVYFIYLNPKSSSKFGAVARIVPAGATTILLKITNLEDTSIINTVALPLAWSGLPSIGNNQTIYVTISSYDQVRSGSSVSSTQLTYGISTTQGGAVTTNPTKITVNSTPINWSEYSLPSSSINGTTKCISKADANKWAYSSSAQFVSDACSNSGFPGSNDTIGRTSSGCASSSAKIYDCNPKVGNVNVTLPTFGKDYTYIAKSYNDKNALNSGNTLTSLPFPDPGATSPIQKITATAKGSIVITVTAPASAGGTVSNYHWTTDNFTPAFAAPTGFSAQGTYNADNGTITIPTLTVNVNLTGSAATYLKDPVQ